MDRNTWTRGERAVLDKLDTPERIQGFLDGVPYSADPTYRSPRTVLRDHQAHCFDGAMFAAAALRRIGHRPLIIDLRAVRDDDHVLALFRRGRHFGAVAKSNFVGLRFREPIFRNLRELCLSYFEDYYNSEGEKTLRAYSTPLDLSSFDEIAWMLSDDNLDLIAARLDSIRHYPLLSPAMEKQLAPVDTRSLRAGMLGIRAAGLYRPPAR